MIFVLVAVVFILIAVCAFKEGSLTRLYKSNGVYGRFTAYLALDLTAVGIAGILSFFIPAMKDAGFPPLLGPIGLILGVLLYAMAYIKCPEHLKKKCIPSMIISGLGITIKICLFFLPFVWRMGMPDAGSGTSAVPETIQDSSGNICRTQINGDFIEIYRPDGSVSSVRRDYIDQSTRMMDVDGVRYHW